MIKQLAKSIREYKGKAILTPILVTLEVIMEVITTYLVMDLIDAVESGSLQTIITVGALVIFIALLALLFGVLGGKTACEASGGFAKNLRHDMYYKIQNFSFANIDKFSTASIITRLTTDVSRVQRAFQMITRITFRAPLMLIFSMIMLYKINANLAKVILCIIPFLVIGFLLIMYFAFPVYEKMFKTYDELNNVVQENVRGVRVVKAFVNEDFEKQKFNKVSKKIYDLSIKAEKLTVLGTPMMQVAMYVAMICISWISAKTIVAGNMTTGALSTSISYAMQILSSLMMVSMIFVMMIMSRASAERIVEILNEKVDLDEPENPVMKVKDGSIEFKNVDFSYVKDENKLALKNVKLSIKSGETIGIIGGTGSSKTTLVQMIPRLYDATKGEVLVGGINVKDYDIKTLRNEVAMVLQKNELFSGTIKENIRWGKEDATDEEIIKVCKLAQADDFVSSFPDKYDTHIEQGGTNVSGGQKQRLCIARALLKKPKILILDDSTSAVDTKTDALIRKAFKDEIPNTTKIIIAQRIASVEDADKIIVLNEGKIEAIGNHEYLMKNSEIYREVYTSQTKGEDENGAKE